MAETKDFQCPNCGSPLNLQGEEVEVKCPYCGSVVIVPEELRPHKEPTPVSFSASVYKIPQYNNDQLSEQISTVGKVATGIAISTMVAPIAITGVILCIVGVFVAFILFSVNSAVRSVSDGLDPHALQTSISATLIPSIAEFPTEAPTDIPPTDVPTETPTPLPTAVPVSTPFSKVLFHDNFTTKKGWSIYKDSYYTLAYVKGGYRIFIDSDGGQTSWLEDANYKDINVTAEIKYVDGPEDGRFGVTCRVKKTSGFYSFEFSPNGWYAIEKYTSSDNGSVSSILAEGTMDTSNFSKDVIFHLRGDCVGHTLTLYMNDEALLQVTDSSFASGGIGLVASTGASGDPGVDVLFRDYAVTGNK
jgi:DNA-directed RNA polymerase subunit RPC12/RpoP